MDVSEIKGLIEAQGRAFEEFKRTNDQRIAEVAKGNAVSDLEAKLATMSDAMSRIEAEKQALEARINKIGMSGAGDSRDDAQEAHKAAYLKWLRKGVEGDLSDLEAKALNVTTDADGGFAVPEEIDNEIQQTLINISPVRAVATVRQISTSDYKKLVSRRGAASGWVDEDDGRTATNTPVLAQVTPFMGEIYANPQATQTMLDDVFFDAEGWLAGEIADEFAYQEGVAFITGNGTKKPKGFLAYTTAATADSARAFGTIQHVLSGADGAFVAAPNGGNCLIDTVHALKAGHRAGAVWMMNSLTMATVRKLKDTDGAYLWRPGLELGAPSSLLGYAVIEAEGMPDIATDSLSIAFGNFAAGYLIVDRVGIRTLRDPYSNKPYVGFYTTKRVGGAVVDSEAIKIVKFGDA
jgi:HK97 family phage major capsid protein